jgi:hypothetical protein
MTVFGLAGLAAPVAANETSHACTVLVGTQLSGASGEPVGVSATSPAGGLGECKLHTLQGASTLTGVDAADGCGIFVDADEDAFVERPAEEGQDYEEGTAFIAFCEAGVTMAENEISLAD